ncbi:MAG: alkaline phosphatase family protein [Prevotellaceae bacterium]|jgi:hypothetical protein|nr:alkaline phosphatase family protein [Prevotellaceae bacterium]
MNHFLSKLLLFIILFFCTFEVGAQQKRPDRPLLVVGIVVDGLQQMHLNSMMDGFDTNGFKAFVNHGTKCPNIVYNTVSAGNAPDWASLMTGSVPFYHGISSGNFFDKKTRSIVSVLNDERQAGIGTWEKYSAQRLLASTVLDELSIANAHLSKNYTVAINADDAIMLGGHTARAVAWIDDVNLKWVTTAYYADGLSRSADEMNTGYFQLLASRDWEPISTVASYLYPSTTEGAKRKGFKYSPTDKKQASASTIIKNTPAANALVTELAIKIIQDERLGKDQYPDMLMLQYTVVTPKERMGALQIAEKEDMYKRLDREIQHLMQQIEKTAGLDNTLIFLTGNQTTLHYPADLTEHNIPSGYFVADRSMALLNTYLMAIYGQEQWVLGYYGKNIYLNKQKMEQRGFDFSKVRQQVADFMLEFEGIQAAYTTSQVLHSSGDFRSETSKLRNSYHNNQIGDVIITLLPGWMEVDEKNRHVDLSNDIQSYVPLFLYGWKIPSKTIHSTYRIVDVAPTLSRILDIPFPNANLGQPIEEIFE